MPPPVGSNRFPLLYTEDPTSNLKLLSPVTLVKNPVMDLLRNGINSYCSGRVSITSIIVTKAYWSKGIENN